MTIRLSGARTELGAVVGRQLRGQPAEESRPGRSNVLINLGLQPANTLLHDGHAWGRITPARIVGDTQKMLAAREYRGAYIVHGSYAFIRAAEQSRRVGNRIRSIVEAAAEAEEMVLAANRPACVLRLGYVYGPESRDLKAYRLAFRIGRPFWAGPRTRLQHHIHSEDAARALLLAARRRAGGIIYATDARPASFADYGDHFARLVGNPLPTHLPRLSRVFAHAVVAEEHMQMVDIGVRGPAEPSLRDFTPRYPDYKVGLAAVVASWSSKG